jgi:hypothetical protein
MKRWRGLKDLVQDAVDSGASALERVQKQAAATPFGLLEKVPPLEAPARRVHALHDAAVGGVYGMVRWVNRGAGAVLDGVLDVLEARRKPGPG